MSIELLAMHVVCIVGLIAAVCTAVEAKCKKSADGRTRQQATRVTRNTKTTK